MCTSFVLYSDKTYIGMNFDISDRPISLNLKGGDQFLVMQKDGPSFLPAFGINAKGTFMNLMMVDPTGAGQYRRGKDCVHIIRIFEDVLGGKIDPEGLNQLLLDKAIVNAPAISVHSMVAGKNREALVIEPGRGNIYLDPAGENFMALTNFPLSVFQGTAYSDVTGCGAERYKTCCRMMSENQNGFSEDIGFAILEKTSQSRGDFPTQFSMLAVPEDEVVYFMLKRDFRRRFAFSFGDHNIRTENGFEIQKNRLLDKKAILLSELEQWKEGNCTGAST